MIPPRGADASFLHLNDGNRWHGFRVHGLDVGVDGALRLRPLPRVRTAVPDGLPTAGIPTPAGIAVGRGGTVYLTVPGDGGANGDRIVRIEGCDGTEARLPCVGGPGGAPTRLSDPRGLLVHEPWSQLLVADAGNSRVQRFDLEALQLSGVWGPDYGLVRPTVLAADAGGMVYVVDEGTHEVVTFDGTGRADRGFWAAAAAGSPAPSRPIGVAVGGAGGAGDGDGVVYVLDVAPRRVFAFDTAGRLLRTFGGHVLEAPMGLAAGTGAVYVGDNVRRRVLVFRPDGELVGEASGYRGPVAALATDEEGSLYLHPGTTATPVRFSADGAWSRAGSAWAGPFSNPAPVPEEWHELAADADLPAGAHLQLFVYAKAPDDPAGDPGAALPWDAGATPLAESLADDQLATGRWLAFPVDDTAGVVHALRRRPGDAPPSGQTAGVPATRLDRLWVGLELTGDGLVSSAVRQVRVDFDAATDLDHLPAIYRDDLASSQFLGRYLALGATAFAGVERDIAALPARFDAEAAPASTLPWLAGWLALDLDRDWTERDLRDAIEGAFDGYGTRGTVAGLRAAVRRYTAAEVHIEEPLQNACWWLLGEGADEGACADTGACAGACACAGAAGEGLDFTTMLAPVEVQGAVLGTTAILDGSRLLAEDEEGSGMFTDAADRFAALIYRGARFGPDELAAIRAVIDREKPAGTLYDLCVIEPAIRVGYQARLGIDTVVAGDAPPTALEDAPTTGLILGGDPPVRLGDAVKVGRSARLG